MKKVITYLVALMIGIPLGGVIALGLLWAGVILRSMAVEDQSALGWTWILVLLFGPLGSVVGAAVSIIIAKRWLKSGNT